MTLNQVLTQNPVFSFKDNNPREKARPPLSWDDISSNPGLFYDTEVHSPPVPLQDPETYAIHEAFALAEWLITYSGLESASPFQFKVRGSDSEVEVCIQVYFHLT